MMKRLALLAALSLAALSLFAQEPVDCVNPFIGTTNFGACSFLFRF